MFYHFLVEVIFKVTSRTSYIYYGLNYKHDNFFLFLKVIFNILYTKFCLDHFFYAASTFVCFSSIWSRFK